MHPPVCAFSGAQIPDNVFQNGCNGFIVVFIIIEHAKLSSPHAFFGVVAENWTVIAFFVKPQGVVVVGIPSEGVVSRLFHHYG